MSDNEYIEHQALTLKNLEKYMTVMKVNTREYGNQTVVAVDDLIYLPTADVAEVKHGKWIYSECVSSYDGAISGYSCSECCAFVDEDFFDSDEFYKDFCGHCGARMDGEGE